jgi:hypothetical protein
MDSAVCIATGLLVWPPENLLRIPAEEKRFSVLHSTRSVMGPIQPPIQRHQELCFSGGKAAVA